MAGCFKDVARRRCLIGHERLLLALCLQQQARIICSVASECLVVPHVVAFLSMLVIQYGLGVLDQPVFIYLFLVDLIGTVVLDAWPRARNHVLSSGITPRRAEHLPLEKRIAMRVLLYDFNCNVLLPTNYYAPVGN